MKNKGLAILLTAALSFSVFITGCNSEKKAEEGKTTGVEKVIKVGAKEDGQPYIYKENGEVKGFEADMWKEISKRTGYKVEYEFNSISGLFGLLDNEKIDTISHFLGKTEQRLEKYDFSNTYAYAVLQLMIKEDAKEIKSVEELYGKNVGVSLGSAAAGVIQKLDPNEKIKVKPYEEFRTIPQDVEMGRLDAYFGNTITMIGDIKNMKINCKINPLVLNSTEVAYPFRKNDEKSKEFITEINKTLKEMQEDGTISKISKEWFDIDVTTLEGLQK